VASREEEKRIKREERLAREEADRRSAARRKRLQYVGGGVLVLAALAAVAVALVTVLGGSSSADEPRQAASSPAGLPKLPPAAITELDEAAKAAGCNVTNAKFEGQDHEERSFTPADYQTNPPTSGNHAPIWYEDGIYEPGNAPDIGQQVHTLEHGRIDVQYRAGTPKAKTDQLESLVAENEGYHMLMYENTTKMPYEVAATAWTQMLGCTTLNDKTFDALRTFRDEYLDKGPEKIP